jgi:hypothetical protein
LLQKDRERQRDWANSGRSEVLRICPKRELGLSECKEPVNAIGEFFSAGICVCESEGRHKMESCDFGFVVVCGMLPIRRV